MDLKVDDFWADRGLTGPAVLPPDFVTDDTAPPQVLPWDFPARVEAAKLALAEDIDLNRSGSREARRRNMERAFDWLAFLTATPTKDDDHVSE